MYYLLRQHTGHVTAVHSPIAIPCSCVKNGTNKCRKWVFHKVLGISFDRVTDILFKCSFRRDVKYGLVLDGAGHTDPWVWLSFRCVNLLI